jgi:hypothetical protein
MRSVDNRQGVPTRLGDVGRDGGGHGLVWFAGLVSLSG